MDPVEREPVHTTRVRFAETDMQGIVFYGNYLTYMDVAHNELLRAVGGLPAGVSEHVVHTEMDYRGQATFEDVVEGYTRFSRLGTASMETEYVATRADGTVLVEGGAVYVAVDDGGATVELPESWRQRVREYQDVPPEGA